MVSLPAELAINAELANRPGKPCPILRTIAISFQTIPVRDICHCLGKYPILGIDEFV